jgi:outer membrane lipoprotein-sorting protein
MINKFLTAAILALIPGIAAADDSAETIVKKVEAKIEGIKTFQAHFARTHSWEGSGKGQVLEGRIMLQKPYLVRIEYPGNTTVVDGKNVWTYLSKSNQVQVSEYIANEKEFPSPQSIFTNHAKNRKAELAGKSSLGSIECTIIKLLSRTPEENSVSVWIDDKLLFPVKTVEESPAGDVITHTLSEIVINGRIDPKVFKFSAPKGAEIIDLR